MTLEILLDLKEPAKTRLIWELLKDNGYTISRASVIYFLEDLEREGLAIKTEKPGKGGFHKLYLLVTHDKAELYRIIAQKFVFKLWEIFPEVPELSDSMKALGDIEK